MFVEKYFGRKNEVILIQQKDAPLVKIINWKSLRFLYSSTITAGWLHIIMRHARAWMEFSDLLETWTT